MDEAQAFYKELERSHEKNDGPPPEPIQQVEDCDRGEPHDECQERPFERHGFHAFTNTT